MSFHKKYLIIVVFIVVLAGYLFLNQGKGQPEQPQLAPVTRTTVRETVPAAGVLNGKDSVTVKFKSGGKLAWMGVKEGDQVFKGQVIALLDKKDLEIALQQALNDYRAKQSSAEKAEDDVKNHDKDESFTQKETRTKAQAARDSAFDAVKAAQLTLDQATVLSPLSGIVINVPVASSQFISATDTITQIVDWTEVFFDAEVDEADLDKIKEENIVEVTLNSFPDQVFSGRLYQLSPQVKTTSGGATVTIARIKLQKPDIPMIRGLNGQAEIIVRQAAEALVIPKEALLDDNTVYVQTGDNFAKVQVSTGVQSDQAVEVTSGLTDNQMVVTNPSVVTTTSASFLERLLPFLRR